MTESAMGSSGYSATDLGVFAPGEDDIFDGPEPSQARFDLATAIRRLHSAVVAGDIPDEELSSAVVAVNQIADELDRNTGPVRRRRDSLRLSSGPQQFTPTSPVIGFANPIAPPVMVREVDGELHGDAYFDYQYEGAPTCVHGGVIAMIFDEMLGAANVLGGAPGMTGTLTIRYRKPTPIRTALQIRAKCSSRVGRKITTVGTLSLGDEVLVEAEGLFLEVNPERFAKTLQSHVEPSGGPV